MKYLNLNNLRCKSWRVEGLLRMLENVMEVAEDPSNFVVYAALGKACRDEWSYNVIKDALININIDESLIVQSGKPIGILKTDERAPLVLMANCNMVGQWANTDYFYELEKKNLICWGGLTAGDWQYIGSQGVIQGTYEIFMQIARKYFSGSLRNRFILTAGCGGMGGSQGLAGKMSGAATLIVDVDQSKLEKRLNIGYLQKITNSIDEAINIILKNKDEGSAISLGLLGNASDVYPEIFKRGIIPDIVTDQTSAQDLIYGYIPSGFNMDQINNMRSSNHELLEQENLKSIKRHVQAMLDFKEAGSIVFDNGNLIRTQAKRAGLDNAFTIPIFTEEFLRDLFLVAIGPFRCVALSGDKNDIAIIDELLINMQNDDDSETKRRVIEWIELARKFVPFEGLPARIAWLGHMWRTKLALRVNELVATKKLKGPVAFTRDHLDAGAMAHPHIMTQNLKDGSDAISDWPLLNALINTSSGADLVAIHSGGGGYSGFMTSSGVTIIADGSDDARKRLEKTLTNDTASGIFRYADASYHASLDATKQYGLHYFPKE